MKLNLKHKVTTNDVELKSKVQVHDLHLKGCGLVDHAS